MNNWYPRKPLIPKQKVAERIIMREAWMEGYNAKELAGYFKCTLATVYNRINVRGLKLRLREQKLKEQQNENITYEL